MLRTSKLALTSMLIAIYSAPAFAHPGHGLHNTLTQGFLHPLNGVDHVLAMVCIGFMAFSLGGRARWAIPVTFLVAMTAGEFLGATVVEMPTVESGIAASVLVLGVLIALAARPPLFFTIPLIALFATFHGAAHGTEGAAGGAFAFPYFSGFLLATVALLGAGIALGEACSAFQRRDLLQRIAGGAVGLTGFLMLLG